MFLYEDEKQDCLHLTQSDEETHFTKHDHNPTKATGEFLTVTRVAIYPGKQGKFFIPLLNVSFKRRGEFFN